MNLHDLLSTFALPHAVAGTAALVLFWCAGLSRKGSRVHVFCGRGYLLAMLAIVVTAIPLVGVSWLRGQLVAAVFLGYLVFLVSLTCRNAWRAVRWKHDRAAFLGAEMRVLAALAAVTGLAAVAYGLIHQVWILIIFGSIGPIAALQALATIRRHQAGVPPEANWWLREHYSAMIGNGVATHIAFFQVGLVRAFPGLDFGTLQHLAWFGPLAVAVGAGFWLNRRYGGTRRLSPAG